MTAVNLGTHSNSGDVQQSSSSSYFEMKNCRKLNNIMKDTNLAAFYKDFSRKIQVQVKKDFILIFGDASHRIVRTSACG